MVSGIELSTNGQKVSWSIAEYLATLEKSAAELLHKDSKSDTKSKPVPKVEAKPGPKREPQNGPVPVASAPKADH